MHTIARAAQILVGGSRFALVVFLRQAANLLCSGTIRNYLNPLEKLRDELEIWIKKMKPHLLARLSSRTRRFYRLSDEQSVAHRLDLVTAIGDVGIVGDDDDGLTIFLC
jgi:hypothetical protein